MIIFNGGLLCNTLQYGVQRYTSEILSEMDNLLPTGKAEVVVPSGKEDYPSYNNIKIVKTNFQRNTRIQKFIWDQFVFPFYVRRNRGVGVDLSVALPIIGCDIVAIHDCRTVLFPQFAKSFIEKLKRFFYMIRVKSSITNSNVIVTVSNSAKRDICRLFKCDKSKVEVVYNAWQHFDKVVMDNSIIDDLGLRNKDFFFTLGSRMRHKNIKWIVAAAQQNPHYIFVVTGSEQVNELDTDYRNVRLSNLIYTDYISDEKVKALMKNCKAFIQPSFYEGFGIPPMEAMSVGAKCIVSNSSSLPEIYKNSVWYIDPYRYEKIDMDIIMHANIEENEIILKNYSWKKSAERLYDIIKETEKAKKVIVEYAEKEMKEKMAE